jgi:polysaccharide pyruvyl transferase CsaB
VEVLVAAWVGSTNLGDELVFRGLCRRLAALGAGVTAVSVAPAATRAAHGVAAIDHRDVAGLVRATRRADLVVLGGGGLVQDSTSALNLPYHLSRLVPARLSAKPLAVVGIGAGPLRGRLGTGLARVALAGAHVCTARDAASAQLMRDLGVSPVELTADLAFALPVPAVAVEDSLVVCLRPWTGRRGRLPVALRRPGDDVAPWFVAAMAGTLDAAASATGLAVRLVAFQADRDGPLHDRVAERLTVPVSTVRPDVDDVVDEVARGRVVVAMRYHALVSAVLGGRPAVSLGYDAKVDSLAADVGSGVVARGCDRSAVESVAEAIVELATNDHASAEAGVVDARARLRRREHGNGTALELLLSP